MRSLTEGVIRGSGQRPPYPPQALASGKGLRSLNSSCATDAPRLAAGSFTKDGIWVWKIAVENLINNEELKFIAKSKTYTKI